jgi:nucleoside-diphosphate-sugar epimerase
MSKVLIVGGAGYVGGYLVDECLKSNHEVKVIDKLLYEDIYLKNVEFIYGDICDYDLIDKHLRWAECVIWLAAFVGDPACALNPALTMQVNVEAVKNMVRNFKGRIIFPSTCSVYGAQDGILTEESKLKPLSIYAESKILAENFIIENSSDFLIFRLGTLFGLGDNFSRLRTDLVLNVLTIRAQLEKKMVVFGGEQFRPLLHVRDFTTAALPEIVSRNTGVYNLMSENLTIVELANRIKKIIFDSEIEISESNFQDSRNYRVSGKKAKDILNFIPSQSIESGIIQIRDLIIQNRIPNVNIPRFSNVAVLRSIL